MKKFFVDFSGYCVIEAKDRDDAERRFWEGTVDATTEGHDTIYEVYSIEECMDECMDEVHDSIYDVDCIKDLMEEIIEERNKNGKS